MQYWSCVVLYTASFYTFNTSKKKKSNNNMEKSYKWYERNIVFSRFKKPHCKLIKKKNSNHHLTTDWPLLSWGGFVPFTVTVQPFGFQFIPCWSSFELLQWMVNTDCSLVQRWRGRGHPALRHVVRYVDVGVWSLRDTAWHGLWRPRSWAGLTHAIFLRARWGDL